MGNTVKGKQRGKGYEDEFKAACMREMILTSDWHRVAKKYDVPESTMRGWWKKCVGTSAAEKRKIFSEAYREQMERIAQDGAAGVRAAMEMANTRLDQAQRNAQRCEEIDGLLVADMRGEAKLHPRAKDKLEEEKRLRPPMGDYPLANYARMFMSVTSKAFAAGGGEEDGVSSFCIEVEVDKKTGVKKSG